jgi:polyhydroxyalkanoate synthesis regulator phasin
MASKKTVLAVAITTIALTAGSFGTAMASPKSGKVTKTSVRTIANSVDANKPGGAEKLAALLSTLVAKGTITQAQADAVLAAQAAAKAAHEANKDAREAGKSIVKPIKGELLTLISTATGVDTATVVTRVRAGESLAEIAGAKKDALVAALVADHNKRIDAAVTAGTLTAAQATILKANVAAHVTKLVEAKPAPMFGGRKGGERGDKGERGPRGRGGEMGGPMGGAPTIPAPVTPSGATA